MRPPEVSATKRMLPSGVDVRPFANANPIVQVMKILQHTNSEVR